ncbi:serine hydrolase domain-containing protein [Alteromonas sp. W364]|uniref:serine hydrolase domain-containing protein n=1 Tax=Alteromonas sp. W364 TaxID=3075610 RepID=UPI0028857C21|nr:serine hydrolase domain-containing protein [Alteromonas sp. W364]MDT0629284.1 serine hydrolase domain-containing protein [Alteromonas sp. W364]
MKKWIGGIFLILVLALGGVWLSLDKDTKNLLMNLPSDQNVMFWSVPQRDAGFRAIDKLPILAYNTIEKGEVVSELAVGDQMPMSSQSIDAYMQQQRTAGIVILHKGKIRLERYGLGFSKEGKWTSFSVAKSFTSTLVGAAIKDGFINSINDKVTDYIPSMLGSAYDDVTVEQLLTMTSGVQWNEDYSDPNSDVSRFNFHVPSEGVDVSASYLRQLPRATEPGTQWLYSTGETNLIGLLVSQATGKQLSQYLSEKVWQHIGSEQDATWVLNGTGHEISGCCIQASTRDFARFGQFIMQGAVVNGESIVPDDWFDFAVTKQADTGSSISGYGYQWWTNNDGSFEGKGIFGQGIFIDPNRELIIATNGNWPKAVGSEWTTKRAAFYRSVQAAIDGE